MSDSEFPSGRWTGFSTYQQFPGKWRTDLNLTFVRDRMTGHGSDCEGQFLIAGSYDITSKECS